MGCSPWGCKESDTTKQLNNGNDNLLSVTTLSGVPGGWPPLASRVPALPLGLAGR